jgi:hypothetical protein
MNFRIFVLTLLAALSTAGAEVATSAEKEKKVHNNRVEYGFIQTGMRDIQFDEMYPGFAESHSGNFLELENKSILDYSIHVFRPTNLELFDVYVRKIPATIKNPPAELICDYPQGGIFLVPPKTETGITRTLLYSYDYLVCIGEGEIGAKRLLEKYIEKYGNYDRKDYDRNQHIYYNVKERFEVRVKPVTSKDGVGALLITVYDSSVFEKTYKAWRAHIRRLEESSKEKF